MGYALKLVHVQPFMSSGTIKSFDISVLCWFSWLNVKQGYVVPTRPVHQHLAQIFRAIITAQCGRFASPLDHLLKRPDNTHKWQGEVNLNAQPFTIIIIYHIESTEGFTTHKLIRHKVH